MINAFRELRLTNTNVKVSGADSRLYVGANTTVFQSETGVFVTTGQTGQFYAASNPSSYTTIAAVDALYYPRSNPSGYGAGGAGGISNLTVTGLTFSGAVVLTGLGNVSVTKSGQTVYFDYNASALATAANLASTGANLQSQITTDVANLAADIINLASTGSNLQTQITNSGNTFAVWTGKFQSFSGSMTPTGSDSYFVQFPINFASVPRVAANVEITGNILYLMNIQNKTISGFTAIFSDLIAESGVSVLGVATLN